MQLNELERINKHLVDNYGYAVDLTLPKFRVVWSSDQFEERVGAFNESTEGGIFLREVIGVQKVPKYPWDKDRFILEHLCYLKENGVVSKELCDVKYSYEWLYTFKDKDSNFLPLNLDVAEIRVYFFLNRHKQNKGVLKEWFENKEKKKRDRIADMIGDCLRSPYFGDLIY